MEKNSVNKILKVKCPQCDTIFSYYESAFRPFCSDRCKMVDLGHWFEETYRVPEKEKSPNEFDIQEENENEYQQNVEQVSDQESEYE
jgi:endogenous inhibitor of DNA gyrase (YacG/DUF329 family)